MKTYQASFASTPTTPTELELSARRIKGTRWFNAPFIAPPKDYKLKFKPAPKAKKQKELRAQAAVVFHARVKELAIVERIELRAAVNATIDPVKVAPAIPDAVYENDPATQAELARKDHEYALWMARERAVMQARRDELAAARSRIAARIED
jgi:hypothetical protein